MKRLWSVNMLCLLMFMFIFLISGCGGGSDKSSSSSSSGGSRTPTSTSSLTGLVDFSSERLTRADTDQSQVEGKVKLIVDLDNDGIYGSSEDKIYETVIENGKFSFTNVEVLEDGITKAKLTIEKEGRAPYEEIVELSNGSSVSVKIETKPVEKVTAEVNREIGGYLIFGIKKNPDGTRKAFVKRSTRADVSLEGTEASVAVPVNAIPNNVEKITASLRLFNGKKDRQYFPGEFVGEGYTRNGSGSVQLESISFAFMDLKDQNGKDIEFKSSENRAEGGMQVTLSVPDDTLSSIRDDDSDKPGVQVPLWTYNSNTGTWTWVGEGDLYDSSGNPVDDIPEEGLTGTGYYVIGTITVANWGDYVNLDYPIFFEEPKQITICVKTEDQSGNPVSGVYVWGEDDTYVDTYTDNKGEGRFVIPVDASASNELDWIKQNYDFYWEYWTYGYMPSQIDESNLTQSSTSGCDYDLNIVIQNPFDAQIEVTVKDENGNSVANKWVEIWDHSYYCWLSKQTNDEGKVIFNVKSNTLYTIRAVGLQKNAEVNGSVDNDETSDNGQLATVEFQEQNIPPNVGMYILPSTSIKEGTSVTAYIYANDENGDNLTLTSAQLGDKDVLSNCSQSYSYAGYGFWTCSSLDTTGLAGTQTFTVKVSDGKVEGSSSTTLTIISGNRSPKIYGIEIYKNDEYVENWKALELNTEYKFVVYAWDPDGDSLSYSWEVSSVNKKTFRNNVNNETYTYTFTSEGDYEIKVTVDDGNGGSDTYSTIIHAGNIAPVISGLGIKTVNPEAGNPIEVFAYAYDPDGDLTADSFSWQIDGESVEPINPQYSGYYYTAQLILPDEIPEEGYFLVRLTVTDKDNKTATNEFKVWINNLPVIDSGLPKNLSLKEGESYTFTVVAHDPDGDALEYKWYVNGQKQSETSSSFTYTFEYAGTYEVKCVISDGISSVEIISTVTVSKEATLTNAEKALSDFLNESTEENYNNLLNVLDSLPEDTKEAHLWKAVATLFKLYRDNKDFFNNLGIGLETNFDTLRPEEVIYNLLNIATYDQDIKEVLADLVKKLDEVNNELVAAEGINTSFSLTGYDIVYFDDIDVKIMEMLVQFSKAICLYLQAVNFDDVTTWTVNGQDIRELIKNGEDISKEQWKEFFNANSQIFTYSDTSKLDEFKNVFKDAVEKYKDIIATLENLDVEKLKERYQHAFSLDDEADVWRAKAVEKTFDSLIAAFDDPSAEIVVPYEEEKDEQYIDGGDGNYYIQMTFDLYLEHYKPTGKDITIYEIVNGQKSLKDVIDAAGKMDYEAYQPYVLYNEELFKENISETYWDEPIKTYTIPKANITIDGDVSDWANVPVFYEDGDLQIKLAYDENDNFYVYVYKASKFGDENEFNCWFERWGPSNEDWFGFEVYSWNGQFNAYMESWAGWTEVNDLSLINNTTVGVEVKFIGGFSNLVQKESMNMFGIYWNYSPSVEKVIKFLPETK